MEPALTVYSHVEPENLYIHNVYYKQALMVKAQPCKQALFTLEDNRTLLLFQSLHGQRLRLFLKCDDVNRH